jgi:hypothetical protein
MMRPQDHYERHLAAERVDKAWHEGRAKETRKHKAGVAKRASFIAGVNAWMVRLLGGGGI